MLMEQTGNTWARKEWLPGLVEVYTENWGSGLSKQSFRSYYMLPSHLLPTSTSCQPSPLANLHLLPISTSCQPPPLANLHLLPTSTSYQPLSFTNLYLFLISIAS